LSGLATTQALAQSATQDSQGTNIKKSEATDKDSYERPWGISGTVVSRVGQGTFADLENQTNTPGKEAPNSTAFNRWLMIYGISPSYEIGNFSLSGDITWTHWLTQGGGYNNPGEFRFEDTYLYGNWGKKIKAIDTNLSTQLSLGFPTSDVSQTATRNLATSLAGSLAHSFDWVTLSYELSGSWLSHESKVPEVEKDVNPLFRAGGAENVGNDLVAIQGVNTQFTLGNTFGASFDIWGDLSGSLSYSYTRYWSYSRDNDGQFASEFQDTGRGTSDLMTSTAMLSYRLHKHLSLSGGIQTKQPPKYDDNDGFRNPIWNTSGAGRNFSSFQFIVSGNY
jgi:hypothetical protein